MKPGWQIDQGAFALFVHVWRERLKLTDRQAAQEAGVSASIICRAEQQKTLSAANYLALCLWMGSDPYAFLLDPETGKRIPSRRAPVSRPDVSRGDVPRGTTSETAEIRQ